MPAGAERDVAPRSWRPEGTRPRKLAPGEGTGRLVHGPGRLWPWPRRPGRGERGDPWSVRHEGATDPSPEGHGSVTGVRPRHGDVGKSSASSRVVRHARRRGRPEVRYPDERSTADSRAQARSSLGPASGRKVDRMLSGPRPRPRERHEARERVTFPASSSPIRPRCGISRTRIVTEVRPPHRPCDASVTEVRPPPVPVTPLPRKPHVPGASWGSQPARTPMRRPGHPSTHLGRPPGPRPSPVLPRTRPSWNYSSTAGPRHHQPVDGIAAIAARPCSSFCWR